MNRPIFRRSEARLQAAGDGARSRALGAREGAHTSGQGGGGDRETPKIIKDHVGVSINGGTPVAGWFISWKLPLKMDEN